MSHKLQSVKCQGVLDCKRLWLCVCVCVCVCVCMYVFVGVAVGGRGKGENAHVCLRRRMFLCVFT